MNNIAALFICLFANLLFSDLELKVNAEKLEYLPGVPINGISVQFINSGNLAINTLGSPCRWEESYSIEVITDQHITNDKPSGIRKSAIVEEIKPNESIACPAFPYILTEPGEYRIRYIYDPSKLLASQRNLKANLFNKRIESKWYVIKILQPLGEDYEVYTKYFTKANMYSWLQGEAGKIIYDKFPRSTYAGYYLCSSRPNFNDAILYLRDRDKCANEHDKTIKKVITREPTIEQIEDYLSYNTDFIFNDVLRYTLAWKLALIGKYDKSKAECDKVIATNNSPTESLRCKEFLDYMKEKGYLKK